MISLVLFGSLIVFIAVGVPISFALGLSALAAIFWGDLPIVSAAQKLLTGIDSFPLLALPFFLLAAELMSGGALAAVLLKFAAQFVGHRRGGLGHTNILTLTFFSGISGSAVADAAGPGAMLIKMMRESGYSASYAAALTAGTAVVGPIIPPSITMIIYALQDPGVSVLGLFWAGVIPGLMISGALLVYNQVVSLHRNYRGATEAPNWREMVVNTWKAIPALVLPVLIVGGIHSGAFTPTEASVVAVFYALIVGRVLYGTLTFDKLPAILLRSALLTVSVLFIVATSSLFAWVLTVGGVPQTLVKWIGTLGLSPWMFLLLVNIFLLLFGIFIEPLPGVMMLTPLLAPMAASLGIDPLHFAIIMIVNLTLGLITPPVGALLFVTALVARISVSTMSREIWPIVAVQIAVLALLTMVPQFSTFLPHAMGWR